MDYYCRECGKWACWCSGHIIEGTLCPDCRVQADARADHDTIVPINECSEG
jgi:hypothetical protein